MQAWPGLTINPTECCSGQSKGYNGTHPPGKSFEWRHANEIFPFSLLHLLGNVGSILMTDLTLDIGSKMIKMIVKLVHFQQDATQF